MTPSIARNLIRMPKERTKRVRTRISYLDDAQQEKFLATAKAYGQREYTMFLFALAHGARVQEIANLRITDIDFRNEQIHIARVKGSLDSTQNLLKVKGNPLFNEGTAFKEWLAVRPADADNFVFNSQKACQMHRVSIAKLYRAIATKAGLPESLRHPHCLKHACAMNMVAKHVDAFMIRQHLGHKSFDSTLAYVNPTDAQASAAASKAFAQIFG